MANSDNVGAVPMASVVSNNYSSFFPLQNAKGTITVHFICSSVELRFFVGQHIERCAAE